MWLLSGSSQKKFEQTAKLVLGYQKYEIKAIDTLNLSKQIIDLNRLKRLLKLLSKKSKQTYR